MRTYASRRLVRGTGLAPLGVHTHFRTTQDNTSLAQSPLPSLSRRGGTTVLMDRCLLRPFKSLFPRYTNKAHRTCVLCALLVRGTGLEPTWTYCSLEPESSASANFATHANASISACFCIICQLCLLVKRFSSTSRYNSVRPSSAPRNCPVCAFQATSTRCERADKLQTAPARKRTACRDWHICVFFLYP